MAALREGLRLDEVLEFHVDGVQRDELSLLVAGEDRILHQDTAYVLGVQRTASPGRRGTRTTRNLGYADIINLNRRPLTGISRFIIKPWKR